MTSDRNETNRGNATVYNDPHHGRTHNSQNPEFEEQGTGRDISEIDQQEGNMDNGESGDQHTGTRDKKENRQ